MAHEWKPLPQNRCCSWMRSKNDSLLDPATGVRYCGTCWQRWFFSRTTGSAHRERNGVIGESIGLTKPSANTDRTIEEDETIGKLEKFVDKDIVYLISIERNLAFSADRTLDGKLQCVGELIRDGTDVSVKPYKVNTVAQTTSFPFSTSPEDHCETPFAAYEDLARYLQYYGKQIGKNRGSLKIWDPFYCNGAVKRNLARLGFFNVHNECEDFYQVIHRGNLPDHDCIVTNPPYSTDPTDHVHELLKYLCSQTKPWFVLQPNYVYMKQYWQDLTSTALPAPRPFFLIPASPRKYKYQTPSGIRQVTSVKKLKTSPFVSMWYCWLGEKYLARMFKWIATTHSRSALPLTLACCEFFIPNSFKDSSDRTRKKRPKPSGSAQDEVKNAALSTNRVQPHKSKRVKRANPST